MSVTTEISDHWTVPQKVSYTSLQSAWGPSSSWLTPTYDFYNPPPAYYYWRTPPADLTPDYYYSSSPSSSSSLGPIIGGIVGAVVLVAVVVCCICCCMSRKRKKLRDQNPVDLEAERRFYVMKALQAGGKDAVLTMPPPMGMQSNNVPPNGAQFAMSPSSSSYPSSVQLSSYPTNSTNYSSGSERPPPPQSPRVAFGMTQSAFTYEELSAATNGFSKANLLGQGGFGYVHKGVLPSGKVVAVKQLKAGSGQGEREFQAEVEVISRVHHRHLVSLVGYCISGDQRMLVYEFIPNGTLEFHLHRKDRATMKWETRIKMAIGSAKGLAYLHEDCQPKIIHRDIKAANILVDKEFEAKVADFGLAKFASDTETHVSTRIMGTLGYLAPEYAQSGKLTDRSDVFSFGVVLLELITGRLPIDRNPNSANASMLEWARPLLKKALQNGTFTELVEPKLKNDYDPIEMKRMVVCAAAAVRHSAPLRPKMSEIVLALEGNMPLEELSEGVKPGQSTMYGSQGSKEYNTNEYKKDLEKFKKLALGSQEISTVEYSGPSTGSSVNPSTSSLIGGQQISHGTEPEKPKKLIRKFW